MTAQFATITTLTPPSSARKTQTALQAAEALVDDSLAAMGQVLTTMLGVSKEASLPPIHGQVAIDSLTKSLVAGAEMRRHLIRTHGAASKAIGAVDLQEMGYGDLGPSPV